MSYLDTKHKRKSASLTTIIAMVILLLIFNFGMRYFDPPKEYGISVNFGTTDFGSGNKQPTEALKPIQQEEPIEENIVEEPIVEEEVVEEQVESVPATNAVTEDVITQNNEESIAIKKREEARKKENDAMKIAEDKRKEEIERKAQIQRQKVIAENKRIEKEKQEQAAKRKQLDALMGGFSESDGKATGGEGNDNKPGDKGKITGDPNASGYYGSGGTGSGGNYQLGNRRALATPKPTYDCNEEGRVFVSISVDKNGRVISATPGVKGSTATADCLLSRAKEAALKTKFNADSNAPTKQIGTIIYNFSLSK